MKAALLNFLMTRLGAWLAPVISGALAAGFAWLGSHVPYGIGAYLSTQDAQTAILGTVFGAVMVWINWLTTNRGFKYGKIVQDALNTIGRPYAITTEPDGVVGPATAHKATLVAETVKIDRADHISKDGIDYPSTSQSIASNPNRKG